LVKSRAILKKLSAAYFLLLISFITTVKAFHSHDDAGKKTVYSKEKNVSPLLQNVKCSICDYQPTKDATVTIVNFTIETTTAYVAFAVIYRDFIFSSFATTSESRGPPQLS
jgi:adenylate kinase